MHACRLVESKFIFVVGNVLKGKSIKWDIFILRRKLLGVKFYTILKIKIYDKTMKISLKIINLKYFNNLQY